MGFTIVFHLNLMSQVCQLYIQLQIQAYWCLFIYIFFESSFLNLIKLQLHKQIMCLMFFPSLFFSSLFYMLFNFDFPLLCLSFFHCFLPLLLYIQWLPFWSARCSAAASRFLALISLTWKKGTSSYIAKSSPCDWAYKYNMIAARVATWAIK